MSLIVVVVVVVVGVDVNEAKVIRKLAANQDIVPRHYLAANVIKPSPLAACLLYISPSCVSHLSSCHS